MALVLRGSSVCGSCEEILQERDEIQGLLHLLLPEHPLWRFSDSAVHFRCFDVWEHRAYFEALRTKYAEFVAARPRLLQSREIDDWLAIETPLLQEALRRIHEQYGFANTGTK